MSRSLLLLSTTLVLLSINPSFATEPSIINDARNVAASSHDYPRLSLGTCWVQDWLTKPEGMAFLYQCQQIYGSSTSEDVLMIKQEARSEGHAACVGGSAASSRIPAVL